jgi:hypothetical protein
MKIICEYIKTSNSVKEIIFTKTEINERLEYLFESLRTSPEITDFALFFSGQTIGIKEIKCICEFMESYKSIGRLYFESNQIGDDEIVYLSRMIETNQSLKYLIICSNEIKEEGMKYLCEALKSNSTLLYLSIAENPIGDKGIKYLSKVLKSNSTLTDLIIGENNFGLKGINHLCEALKSNCSLEFIEFYRTEIGAKGIERLSKSLESNNSLVSICLNKTTFEQGIECLKKSLRLNSNLSEILIGCLSLTNGDYIIPEEIVYYLETNKIKWSLESHNLCFNSFKQAIHTFLLCMKRIQFKTKLKIPKFVLFEIIKFVDRKSFFEIDCSKCQIISPKKEEEIQFQILIIFHLYYVLIPNYPNEKNQYLEGMSVSLFEYILLFFL